MGQRATSSREKHRRDSGDSVEKVMTSFREAVPGRKKGGRRRDRVGGA